ncbi:LOW QUALITY PROTEIN: hypothetical protein PHMEG_00021934 [Phytophthora megakarya]|uniref:Uncharacterized protein n=1 Tax=Phytophthora megakarya TaxID=4795 RepID=A0A225VKN0_9STRA|nr:LOW QUALITY PROTEIN: hypothetical protein PHMEG_00021934 [Phytophthora megakarya]
MPSATLHQFGYVVNSIWVQRLRYRMILGGTIRSPALFDTLIRQVARSVLHWPYSLPRSIYFDQVSGIGLLSCELDTNVHQYQETLRILNTPALPVHHKLVKSLEACQVNAGLTDNPLTVRIEPPIHVTTWIAQVIRFAAAISLHYVRCKQGLLRPTGITSSNYASLVTFAQSLGLDCSRKMNCVGKESGKRRTNCELVLETELWWYHLIPQGLNQSFITIDWVKVIWVMLHVIHWELLLQLGGGVKRNSEIWYERTHLRDVEEFEAICVPVIPTYLPRIRNHSGRIIVWTHTVVDGVHRVNDREILQEALKRNQFRYKSTLATDRPIDLATACSECGRHRGSQRNDIIPIVFWSLIHVVMQQLVAHGSAIFATRSDEVSIQAGDGCVMQANTAAVHGDWAIQAVGGLLLWVNFTFTAKISPPHAAKYMVYLQEWCCTICDNKSEITILGKAHTHANGTMPLIKCPDPHGMKIRSLGKAMCQGGSFRIAWAQSHKKHEYAEDILLQRQRKALDVWIPSHCQVMVESYSTWMAFYHYLLFDDGLRPVVGNTLLYLYDRAQADLRRGWNEKQSQKPASRHTMTTDEVPMTNTEECTDALRKLYWRAPMNILHTNLVKHNFDQRWTETCLLCDSGGRDTQDHRFGLEQPCPKA